MTPKSQDMIIWAFPDWSVWPAFWAGPQRCGLALFGPWFAFKLKEIIRACRFHTKPPFLSWELETPKSWRVTAGVEGRGLWRVYLCGHQMSWLAQELTDCSWGKVVISLSYCDWLWAWNMSLFELHQKFLTGGLDGRSYTRKTNSHLPPANTGSTTTALNFLSVRAMKALLSWRWVNNFHPLSSWNCPFMLKIACWVDDQSHTHCQRGNIPPPLDQVLNI